MKPVYACCEKLLFGLVVLLFVASVRAQSLSVKWEALTGPDFIAAIKKAQNTCVLPFGIFEKHGPHLPVGTDLINARYAAVHLRVQLSRISSRFLKH